MSTNATIKDIKLILNHRQLNYRDPKPLFKQKIVISKN